MSTVESTITPWSPYTASIIEKAVHQNPFTNASDLADPPPPPSEAHISRDLPSLVQIPLIQKEISSLCYNYLPFTFFSLEKHRSLDSIVSSGKEVLQEALPIRCLEATFVGLYLTQPLENLHRFPLSFSSRVKHQTFNHIVLVLYKADPEPRFGALGLSRKQTLMDKPMEFTSLFDLIMNYKNCYEALGHRLSGIRIGLPFSHHEGCERQPCWRFIALKLDHYRNPAYKEKSSSCEKKETNDLAFEGEKVGDLQTVADENGGLSVTSFSVLWSPAEKVPSESCPRTHTSLEGAPAVTLGSLDVASPAGGEYSPCSEGYGPFSHVDAEFPVGEDFFDEESSLCITPEESKLCRPNEEVTPNSRENEQVLISPSSLGEAAVPSVSELMTPPQQGESGSKGAMDESSRPFPSANTSQQSVSDSVLYSKMRKFLSQFEKLLLPMAEDYDSIPVKDLCGRHATRVCFADLDQVEGNAKVENKRRLYCIERGISPLSKDSVLTSAVFRVSAVAEQKQRALAKASALPAKTKKRKPSIKMRKRSVKKRKHSVNADAEKKMVTKESRTVDQPQGNVPFPASETSAAVEHECSSNYSSLVQQANLEDL